MAGKRRSQYRSGTLGAIIERWRSSQQWRALKPTSQARYLRLINHLTDMSDVDVKALRRRHIIDLQDEFADAPATANGLMSVLSLLLGLAVEWEYLAASPFTRIKRLKLGSHRRWLDEDVAHFLAAAPEPMRRAAVLVLETGQRRIDAIAMLRPGPDGVLRHRQQKTGMLVEIPMSALLRAEIAEWTKGSDAVTILANTRGRPWTYGGFGASWDQALRDAGLSGRLTFHGLRATFACRAVEAGMTLPQVMAICGWKSVKQAMHYLEDVNRAHNARAGIHQLDEFRDRARLAKEAAK
jgi:integrase